MSLGKEIERKFLVKDDAWEDAPQYLYVAIEQGYLITDDNHVLRIRTVGREGWLTIKSAEAGMTRMEYEYPIPYSDALTLLNRCPSVISKERFDIIYDRMGWTVDVFSGDNEGLVLAEIELASEDQTVKLPEWVGDEVTADRKYYNADLAQHPYTSW